MSKSTLLDVLRTSQDAAKLLERDFDFLPLRAPSAPNPSFFHLSKEVSCEIIGTDTSGGEFALCKKLETNLQPLLYVSSEGHAGIIGRNLSEGLSIIIELPYWRDCLKFSGAGQLNEMRRVVPLLEADFLQDAPHLNNSRNTLRTLLRLMPLSDPLHKLHTAVSELTPLFPAYASAGFQLAGLFNKFTVMSNPDWRRKLEANK